MLVITRFGLGRTEADFAPREWTKVILDNPTSKGRIVDLEWNNDVFPFTPWGIVRIIFVRGVGYVSNLQFLTSAKEAQLKLREIIPFGHYILINFEKGSLDVKSCSAFLNDCYIWIRPWVDRWAREKLEYFEIEQEALSEFRYRRERVGGSIGISSSILMHISSSEGKLLWIYFLTEDMCGPFAERKYI